MGSYDTGECNITPRRSYRSYDPPSRPTPPPSEEDSTPIEDRIEEAMTNYTPTNSEYDPDLKTIVSLGGGLTPSRIVQPLPEEVKEGSIREVVKYLMSDEVAGQENQSIVDAVRSRMSQRNYRLVINSSLNLGNDKIITDYLQIKTQQGEEDEIKFNYADVAIVSHDEGGNKKPKAYTLEGKL